MSSNNNSSCRRVTIRSASLTSYLAAPPLSLRQDAFWYFNKQSIASTLTYKPCIVDDDGATVVPVASKPVDGKLVRKDGRHFDELRQICTICLALSFYVPICCFYKTDLKCGIICQASGSAYMELKSARCKFLDIGSVISAQINLFS